MDSTWLIMLLALAFTHTYDDLNRFNYLSNYKKYGDDSNEQ